jgi:hypothetical protein
MSPCFEETRLPRIHEGDRASIRMMGAGTTRDGHVESFARAIAGRENTAGRGRTFRGPLWVWLFLGETLTVTTVAGGIRGSATVFGKPESERRGRPRRVRARRYRPGRQDTVQPLSSGRSTMTSAQVPAARDRTVGIPRRLAPNGAVPCRRRTGAGCRGRGRPGDRS